jgi:hypothetical protein
MTQAAYGKPLPVLIEVAETTNARTAAKRELVEGSQPKFRARTHAQFVRSGS